MTTTGNSLAGEGMYSQLIEDEGSYDEFNSRPDVGLGAHPVSPVRMIPRPSGPGPYRFAIICLAVLCAILLISIIAVTAHYKSKPQGGGETASEIHKQTQDANVSALTSSISKLQQEKIQLQKEKDELKAKLAAAMITKAPEVIKPTMNVEPAQIVCPTDWHLFSNSCYFISRNTRDWPDSQSFCQKQGAHLAIIHTPEEQTFLWNLLPRGHWNAYWFGITDEHTEDQWKWVDGTPLVGGFWEVGEPNNHIDEDCGYIVKTRVLERVAIRSWYDAPCSMYWPFICEKEMGAGASNAAPH
ncbi:CD209 antigen-like protein E [Micropterus salmoides]|uniref:CD209 antigen-like protein E n=1 Tax=Micropterus salmoides TaxID=27706 RepID=UPI0018EE2DF1|nr:CD209 antigen-like protein E [Micropterus salmoides]XP_045915335.1 CD209 antigen-like protein E [Micropterus dolomieu]